MMEDDQQFCLRWNNHQSTLVSVFDTLLEKGIHVDCTLAAEGQTLKAHKVVLSACSPYFESVLSQQYDKHPIIILKDVKYAELRAMMDYMYRGEVNISQDQLAALLKAAESLQIKGLSDNKPSRPPSRPAPPPPRAVSPPPQVRDGSVDSRSSSASPTRRRKKARRASTEPPTTPADTTNNATTIDTPHCKDERPALEDLTLDEDNDDQPAVMHNDVVRNFQWHMERSQDEIMNSSDSIRDSQDTSLALPSILPFMKKPFPITRGYLKCYDIKQREPKVEIKEERGSRVVLKRRPVKTSKTKGRKCTSKKRTKDINKPSHVCDICQTKRYKYRRNKLRHEKYECVTGPQFECEACGKKYSQKKTLTAHLTQKHTDWQNMQQTFTNKLLNFTNAC